MATLWTTAGTISENPLVLEILQIAEKGKSTLVVIREFLDTIENGERRYAANTKSYISVFLIPRNRRLTLTMTPRRNILANLRILIFQLKTESHPDYPYP
jgi:hypothetical protein